MFDIEHLSDYINSSPSRFIDDEMSLLDMSTFAPECDTPFNRALCYMCKENWKGILCYSVNIFVDKEKTIFLNSKGTGGYYDYDAAFGFTTNVPNSQIYLENEVTGQIFNCDTFTYHEPLLAMPMMYNRYKLFIKDANGNQVDGNVKYTSMFLPIDMRLAINRNRVGSKDHSYRDGLLIKNIVTA